MQYFRLTMDTQIKATSVLEKKRGRPSGGVIWARLSFERSMIVPEYIWKSGDGDFTLMDLAKGMNCSPNSGSYQKLLRAAYVFDLITDSYSQDLTKTTSITDLARSIVAPKTDEDPKFVKIEAFLKIDLYNKLFKKFNGKPLPTQSRLENDLVRIYRIPSTDKIECAKMFLKNIEYLEMIVQIKGVKYIGIPAKLNRTDDNVSNQDEVTEQSKSQDEVTEQSKSQDEVTEQINKHALNVKIPKAFISHSKNAKILDQIKTILDLVDVKSIVAEEEKTAAMPISDKIFGLMQQCNCAIINISADDEMKQDDDSYKINENVLIEIGAAFMYYDKRVILLADERLELPSNLQGLYLSKYTGNDLSFSVSTEIQKIFKEFKTKIQANIE